MKYFKSTETNDRGNKALFINQALVESIEQVDLDSIARIRMTSGKEHTVLGSVAEVARQLSEEF